jgi:hypothetical protein
MAVEQKKHRAERRSQKQVLEEFGILEMRNRLEEMAGNVSGLANAVAHFKERHDGLVKKCAEESSQRDDDIARLERRWNEHQDNLHTINELRNRGFWGRMKWLLFGR